MLKEKFVFVRISEYLGENSQNLLNKLLKSFNFEDIKLIDLLNQLPKSNEISTSQQTNIDQIFDEINEIKRKLTQKESIMILSKIIKIPNYESIDQKFNTAYFSLEKWYSMILENSSKYLLNTYQKMNNFYGIIIHIY